MCDAAWVHDCRCKQAEILAGVCGQRESLERKVYEQDMQLELHLDELETTIQVSTRQTCNAAQSSNARFADTFAESYVTAAVWNYTMQ